MKPLHLVIGVFCWLTFMFVACEPREDPNERGGGQTSVSQDDMIKRGEYLVSAIGCHDCHTPKKMGPHGPEFDLDVALSGHRSNVPLPPIVTSALKDWVLFNMESTAAVGPWGVSFSANLTSDETGIGNWTEEQFLRAIREGKYKGQPEGRSLLPPMPWQEYRKLGDNDLKAIFAYLKSTKPVRNVVPAPIPPDQLAAKE